MMLNPLGRIAISSLLLLLVCGVANADGARPNEVYSPKQGEAFPKLEDRFESLVNEAQAFLDAGLYREAERAARCAIDLRKSSRRARYLLGLSLSMGNRSLNEGVENLAWAAEEFPEAHLELSRIYVNKGDFQRAMRELDQFTRKAKPEFRQFLAK